MMSQFIPATPPRLHRAVLGRADLLRALIGAGSEHAAHWASLLGFEAAVESQPSEARTVSERIVATDSAEGSVSRRSDLPLQATHYLVRQSLVDQLAEAEQEPAEPLDAIPESAPGARPLPQQALAPKARLAGLARRYLRRPGASRLLDLDRWVDQVARGTLPARLPTRRLRQWGESAALVINGYGCHAPIHADLAQLVEVVRANSAAATPVFWLNPEGRWLRLQRGRGKRRWTATTADAAQRSSHWLFAGADTQSPAELDWSALVASRLKAGGSVAWLKAGRLTAEAMPAGLRMVRWDIGSGLRESRPQHGASQTRAFDRLIAALTLAVRVEPALLRAIRLLLKLPVEAEITAWMHVDVHACAEACCVLPDRVAHWRAVARARLTPLQRAAVARCIAQHHTWLSPLVQSEEAAIAVDLAPEAVDPVARERWRMVSATLKARPEGATAQALANYMRRLGGRADAALFEANSAVAEAWLRAERDALNAGTLEVPAGISAKLAQRVLSDLPTAAIAEEDWSVVQRGAALWMVPGRPRTALATMSQAGRGVLMEQESSLRWLDPRNEEIPLIDARLQQVRLRHGGFVSEIHQVPRPVWAHEFGHDAKGVYALSPPLGTRQERFEARLPADAHREAWFVTEARSQKSVFLSNVRDNPDLSLSIGVDEDFGVYADLRLQANLGDTREHTPSYEQFAAAMKEVLDRSPSPDRAPQLRERYLNQQDKDQLCREFGLTSQQYERVLVRARARLRSLLNPLDEAVQRFRWIAPGEFLMGSTDAERARIQDKGFANWSQDEAPRHRVQLSRGYWLADTPCTQAFWSALLQNNPSEFNDDPQRPVDNVSWDKVQGALQALSVLLPEGCSADLPTEAEWEYACRAGTPTAFSTGDALSAAQARFRGEDEFGRGDGDAKWGTAPVASYPANPWGLFDMHGNVWEWCRDGLRTYTGADELDPEGPLGAARALRGGSWFDRAGVCRSAFRDAIGPGRRSNYLGFRLVLRSKSPVALPEAVLELAPEAPAPARRDAGQALIKRLSDAFRPKKGKPK